MMANVWYCTECGERSAAFSSEWGAKNHVRQQHGIPSGSEDDFVERPAERTLRLRELREEQARRDRHADFECERVGEELNALGWFEPDFGAEDFLYWSRGPQSA